MKMDKSALDVKSSLKMLGLALALALEMGLSLCLYY